MVIKKIINEKSLKLIFAGFVSYYFSLMILQSNFKAIALLGLAVFIILFLTRIEYAFYFILASRSIVDVLYGVDVIEGTRMTHLIGALLIFLFLYYIVVVSRYNIFNIFSLDINKIYGIFLIISIPSIFFTQNLTTGLGYWFRLAQGFLFLNMTILIILNAGSELYKKRMNIICWAVILFLLLPYILYLKNYFQGTYVLGSGALIRYSTFTAHSNVFPYFSLIVLPFCLFLYSVYSKKIFFLIFMAIISCTAFLTYTRNVWIGLGVLLLAYNVIRKNFTITLTILGFFILMIIFNPLVRERLGDIYMAFTSKGFFELDPKLGSGRIGLWQNNIRYFIDHSTLIEKLLGNGFDVKLKIGFSKRGSAPGEHNNYVTLLMNTGIFGLFTYLLYILKLFQESFKLLRRTKEIYLRSLAQVFIPLLLSYLIISVSTHIQWFISFQYFFSTFAGFVIAANILEKKQR